MSSSHSQYIVMWMLFSADKGWEEESPRTEASWVCEDCCHSSFRVCIESLPVRETQLRAFEICCWNRGRHCHQRSRSCLRQNQGCPWCSPRFCGQQGVFFPSPPLFLSFWPFPSNPGFCFVCVFFKHFLLYPLDQLWRACSVCKQSLYLIIQIKIYLFRTWGKLYQWKLPW